MPPNMPEVLRVIKPPGPKWFHIAVAIAGAVYLAAIFAGSAGSALPEQTLPRPLLYFTQVACLFPQAATHSIEYRVTAYSCRDRRFRELDYRTYFPIHPDDKENRYQRLAHFHRRNLRVMQALDEHLGERHNARVVRGESPGDGIDGPIGGIMVMSLRIPFQEPGGRVGRYAHVPLAKIPPEWRKYWYTTRIKQREARCAVETR